MSTELKTILRLEVPFVVVVAERDMRVREVRDMVPGTIIELPKTSDSDLDVRINNRSIGSGSAVKIGENFGVRITYVGDPAARIEAMGDAKPAPKEEMIDGMSAEDLAAALLAGQ